MPTLNWIGKEAVVKHHKEVPYRLLEPVSELSCGDANTENLIVQGDNLHALKALLPRYAGQVKCIYIDPPYNTGNEGWAYNDNVNSPEIKRWLGEVVGKEGETLDRHDRWLCMMYPRLLLLKQFLREDGAVFVSIDDNEVATLRLLMDEIFGEQNFVTTIIWEKNYAPKASSKYLSENHDYVVLYAKKKSQWKRNLIPRSEKQDKAYKNPDNDPRGLWRPNNLAARNSYSLGIYSINCPSGRVIEGPPKGSYWRVSKAKFDELDKDGRIWWGKEGNNVPAPKIFLSEVKQGIVPMTIWTYEEAGHTQDAKKELIEVLPEALEVFTTPKPPKLIERIIQLTAGANDIVLDSFAGSGTTGHAVLKLNKQDGGNRRFILVEMDDNIARNVTAERVRRVAQGYTNGKDQAVEGLGGSFQFCTLSKEPLFTAEGQIRSDVTFAQLAEFVWFVETGTGIQIPLSPPFSKGEACSTPPSVPHFDKGGLGGISPLLGTHEGRAIYLLYNGILKDKSVAGGNVLTGPVYDILPPHDGPKVIFAAASRLGAARLALEQIVFKQTPYALGT